MAEQLKKQNGVIWFDKAGLSIYIESKPFIRFNFTPDVVNQLEIIDKAKLETAVHTFVSQNKLGNLSLIIILSSDILFEKEWPIPQTELQTKEETDFIDSLPFENVTIHSWSRDSKKKLIAVNRDFVTVFKEILEKDACHILAAFPYSLFSADVRNESVKDIWKKMDVLKHDNLIEKVQDQPEMKKTNIVGPDKKQGRSILPFLIPVFVLLMGVLAYLLLKK